MTRMPTLPPTDRGMWRRLIAKAHPDAGGDHELFIWAGSMRDLVCNGKARPEPAHHGSYQPPNEEPARVPYPPGTDFREATRRALRHAGSQPDGYRYLLSLLSNCYLLDHLHHEQNRGASYKRLAAIGHMAGMTKEERIGWYRLAESIPLSDRHTGHILSRLKREAA